MIFELDIELGKEYVDEVTGFRGFATDVSFNYMKCCRVWLEPKADIKKMEMKDGAWFDSPRLRPVTRVKPLGAGMHFKDRKEFVGYVEATKTATRTGGPVSRIK